MSTIIDNAQQLPVISAEGRGTFGCLVNGAVFLPNPVPGQQRSAYGELQYYKNITGINIYVDDYRSNRAIILFLYHPEALVCGEEYDLSDPEFFVQYIDFTKPPSTTYRAEINGTLRIEKCELKGRDKKIIAGSFEFSVLGSDGEEAIEITAGRFDIGDIIS